METPLISVKSETRIWLDELQSYIQRLKTTTKKKKKTISITDLYKSQRVKWARYTFMGILQGYFLAESFIFNQHGTDPFM